VGTVVEAYGDDFYEVEFSDNDGRTYGLETLPGRMLLVLRYEPIQT
jgi:hypothetical protein